MFRFCALTVCTVQAAEQLGFVSGVPSWAFLVVDRANDTSRSVATMNQDGKSVWDCPDPYGYAKDVLPSGHLVTLRVQKSDIPREALVLAEVDGACRDVVRGALAADAHEARIDEINTSKVVGIASGGCRKHEGFVCEGILHFDRTTGVDTMLVDLGDHFDPSRDWGMLSTDFDWMHTNAASTGSHNNFLVSIRHLSAVVSFDYTSLQKQWVLSSEVSSNFSFDNDSSQFYNPHDAHQLSNGNILLFDNGNVRNEHISESFSRAAEYSLDFTNMMATLVWEFRVSFCETMGSARRLPNGHTLVHCSHCVSASGTGIVYEVDSNGVEISRVELTSQLLTYRAQPVIVPPHNQQIHTISV